MLPFVLPGSRLVVETINCQTIRVGDVVCFPAEHGRVVAHRVIKIYKRGDERYFRVRGDSSARIEDMPLKALAYLVIRVENRFFSYETRGLVGAIFAKLAVSRIMQFTGTRLAMRKAIWLLKA